MQKVVGHGLTMSWDGYSAGPDQSLEAPLGVGGERLHDWAFATRSMRELHGLEGGEEGVDDQWARRSIEEVGATIMGRNMFGPVRGPWEGSEWRGWWGEDPPFHHPVFVLTRHARPDLAMAGGTTFHFVTGGIHDALERARAAAGDLHVRVGGGPTTMRQFLDARLIDELHLVVVPVLLGGGTRLFEKPMDGLVGGYETVGFAAGERAAHALLARRDA